MLRVTKKNKASKGTERDRGRGHYYIVDPLKRLHLNTDINVVRE